MLRLLFVFFVVMTGWGVFFNAFLIELFLIRPNPTATNRVNLSLPSPSPTPYRFTHYTLPQISPKDAYSIFFVGDSMTETLGPHPYRFSLRINAAYPEKQFIIDNYAIGSKNVLDLFDLLSKPLLLDGKQEPAALERDFDIIVIESFGNNPLSNFSYEEGALRQIAALDDVMTVLTRDHPQAVVIFLATLAPSVERYGDGLLNLSNELKAGYVKERKLYIENHIAYATAHNIPLLNLYEETLGEDGKGTLKYLRVTDYLHPSQEGIEWIQDRVADFIIENEFLPH